MGQLTDILLADERRVAHTTDAEEEPGKQELRRSVNRNLTWRRGVRRYTTCSDPLSTFVGGGMVSVGPRVGDRWNTWRGIPGGAQGISELALSRAGDKSGGTFERRSEKLRRVLSHGVRVTFAYFSG
jgi:hypothetical protein